MWHAREPGSNPEPGHDPDAGRDREPTLPFRPGEILEFSGDLGRFGRVGRARMTVTGPERLRNTEVLRLDFRFQARVTLVEIRERATSWLDPDRMASLRYRAEEHHPLSRRTEDVEIFPEEERWSAREGKSGRTPSPAPLDELSFLFFLRTVELEEGEERVVDRHFDPDRSPVRLRGRANARIRVPFGELDTRLVEMEVRDRRRFGGTGRVGVHVGRVPGSPLVRIESELPMVGTLVLALSGWNREAEG
jgi:hypothetical protein